MCKNYWGTRTSRRRRSTRRWPTSTSARSTRRHTRGRTDARRIVIASVGRPPLWAAFAILLLSLLSACDSDDGAGPTATPAASSTPAATSTPEPPPALESLIAPRGDAPEADPFDLAERYGMTSGSVPREKPPGPEPQIGDAREFNVFRLPSSASGPAPVATTIRAILRAKSEHALFYVHSGYDVSRSQSENAASFFEEQTWPVVTGVFGLPPIPGVDGDPRVVVLQAELGGVGGYVSPDDLLPREVRPLSNEADMIYMDTTLSFGSDGYNTVLAHELQHLIMEESDAGEESWVNEGLSETAYGLVGPTPSTVSAFAARPETQLNHWSFSGTTVHYGAGAAFHRYVADRFGGDPALGGIARADGDGPAGLDEFLQSIGERARFASVFADWIAANLLNEPEGPYGNPSGDVVANVTSLLSPGDAIDGNANQFGSDYYQLEGLGVGQYELRFSGARMVEVLPTSPADEGPFWWSNRGDQINTRLTRQVDLPALAPVLTFRTWYDIERWYDRAYVAISTDDGATWTALPGVETVAEDPVRLAMGPGWQGTSGDPLEPVWIDERVDLAAYAGQRVLMRFEYVTDGGSHGDGWAIDDIRINGTEVDDGEAAQPGWESEGWVRLDAALPQRWIVRLVGRDAAGAPLVRDVPVDAANNGGLRFDGAGIVDPVLVVAGATEGTNQRSSYRVELVEP